MDNPLTPEAKVAIDEAIRTPRADLMVLADLLESLEDGPGENDPATPNLRAAIAELKTSRTCVPAGDLAEEFPSSSRAKTDLPHLRRIVLGLEHGKGHEEGKRTLSEELLAEISETCRAAAVELAYYRTLFKPGFVGEDGLRFDDLRDLRADYVPKAR